MIRKPAFEFTDKDGDQLGAFAWAAGGPGPCVGLVIMRPKGKSVGLFVPLDHVEEVVAGIRDAARQASGQATAVCHPHGYAGECPCPPNGRCCKVAPADPTTADDPTPLRWGLGDVLHGDDDTRIVCLSGPAPDYRPYWLELEPERVAALRDDLAAPEEETHVVADDSDDPEHVDDCPGCEVGIEHTEHCPTPETHNWGCGCRTDERPVAEQPETCRPVEVDGITVLVRGAGDWTDEERAHASELAHAARRRFESEPRCPACKHLWTNHQQGACVIRSRIQGAATVCGCPETEPAPAAGLSDTQPANDRAAVRERVRLAVAQWHLDESGSGRTVHDLDDTEFGTLADAVLSVLTEEDETR